jgi:ElaB/YqjD/DUF883 family membrane-anchored ribosome-binding protein
MTTTVTRDPLTAPVRESMTGTLGESLDQLRDRAGDLYGRAKDRAIAQEHRLENYVEQHPIKSVLVAAGVGAGFGLLAGFLMARR